MKIGFCACPLSPSSFLFSFFFYRTFSHYIDVYYNDYIILTNIILTCHHHQM